MKYVLLFLTVFLLQSCSEIPHKRHTIKAVQDNAQIMSAIQQRRLTNKLVELEKSKSVQMVVLTVNSIPNSGTIEAYANEFFNSRGIGKINQDRGLLLVMSMKSKKIRLEVGRGNEGWMPDHKANEYIEKGLDDFKQFRYYEGIDKIVNEVSNNIGE